FLGIGKIIFPEYQKIFGQKSKLIPISLCPPVNQLRKNWNIVCEKSKNIYDKLSDEELLKPHALVEDFEKDYFKTKERVIMSWHLHQLYHAGQLGVIASVAGKNKY